MGRELDSKSLHDAEKSGEPGIAGGGQGFVEGFARNASLAGELGHSNGAGDIAEGRRDEGRIAI